MREIPRYRGISSAVRFRELEHASRFEACHAEGFEPPHGGINAAVYGDSRFSLAARMASSNCGCSLVICAANSSGVSPPGSIPSFFNWTTLSGSRAAKIYCMMLPIGEKYISICPPSNATRAWSPLRKGTCVPSNPARERNSALMRWVIEPGPGEP